MQWLKRAWRGEEKLWKVFWLYFFALLALSLLISIILKKIINPAMFPGVLLTGLPASFFMMLWSALVWRSARNTNAAIWKYGAKTFAGISFFYLFVFIFSVPSIWRFEHDENSCKDLLVKYAERNKIPLQYYIEQHPDFIKQCLLVKPECEFNLSEYAIKNGIDPQQYVNQNLSKCIDSVWSNKFSIQPSPPIPGNSNKKP